MHTADLDAARAAADRVFRNQPGVGASVMGLIAQIFPHQHTVPKDYFTLSGKEAERVDAEIERHVRARELQSGQGQIHPRAHVHRQIVALFEHRASAKCAHDLPARRAGHHRMICTFRYPGYAQYPGLAAVRGGH